jgi:hypothetical protein
LSGAIVRSVAKLARITFLSLALSHWIDYLGFITEGKLAAVLIIPSLGVPNWSVIYIINTAPSSKFSGAVAGEREDFCKGSLARTIFYIVFSFALLYFCLHHFIKNTKKIVSFIVAFIYLLLVLLEWVLLKTPSCVTLLAQKTMILSALLLRHLLLCNIPRFYQILGEIFWFKIVCVD